MLKNVLVKDLPVMSRPREKMFRTGVESLSDIELLAVLLRSGTKKYSVLHLAERLLAHYKTGGLSALRDTSLQELQGIEGIGPVKAGIILASLELGRRATYCHEEAVFITSPEVAAQYVRPYLSEDKKEKFAVLLLNVRQKVLSFQIVSVGTLTASLVHPREVFKMAIRWSAYSMILVHNHPSGDTTPSREDMLLTVRLQKAGKIMGIEVVDHIIIAGKTYLSFREDNLLNGEMI